jgi:flagellar hook-associated protein 2
VVNHFQADNSFGSNLSTALSTLDNTGPNGLIYLALQEDSTEESGRNTTITNENNIIRADQTQLNTDLNEANCTLEKIPTRIDEVDELYSAITGYDENPQG